MVKYRVIVKKKGNRGLSYYLIEADSPLAARDKAIAVLPPNWYVASVRVFDKNAKGISGLVKALIPNLRLTPARKVGENVSTQYQNETAIEQVRD